jgi:NlpC/P60 family putative phage cell wall peptidase
MIEIAPGDALPGDVLLFRWRQTVPAKHAGLLATPMSFIHAYDGTRVVESPLGPWWSRRIAFAFRFPDL